MITGFDGGAKWNEEERDHIDGEGVYEESGMIYLRNRYYDPQTGRFITEDPAKDGTNWYVYCSNNPVMFVDSSGLDAVIITNKNAAWWQGHTSAVYQNANGDWYYTYWGNKAAAVIRISNYMMGNMDNFNSALNSFLEDNGFGNITSDYTDAIYVVGDFTASLTAAYDDVYAADIHKKSKGTISVLGDGSKVHQGKNGAYDLKTNNCLHRTYQSLSKGALADGTSMATYLTATGVNTKVGNYAQPNVATPAFAQAFMNSSFSKFGARQSIINYANLYDIGSEWAQVYRKGMYARAVRGY